jgi:hypothetical protein
MKTLRYSSAIPVLLALALAAGGAGSLLGACGPFHGCLRPEFLSLRARDLLPRDHDRHDPTTYSPEESLNRLQAAAFLARAVDGTLKRGNRRTALGHLWTPTRRLSLQTVTVGYNPSGVAADGMDIWVAN